MVGHVHAIRDLLGRQPGRALDCAREVLVGGGERGLPDLGELIHQPGERGLVGAVIESENRALVGKDHGGESRPVVQAHGDLRRRPHQVHQPGALDGATEVSRIDEVKVAHKNRDDLVRVLSHPAVHARQVVFQGADIEQVAIRVAEV